MAGGVTLDNTTGLVTESGTIKGALVNSGGTLLVDAGQTITVTKRLRQRRPDPVEQPPSWLKGGAIADGGADQGRRPDRQRHHPTPARSCGGPGRYDYLTAAMTNEAAGSSTVAPDSTLNLGFDANAGLVSLAGGAIVQSDAATIANAA